MYKKKGISKSKQTHPCSFFIGHNNKLYQQIFFFFFLKRRFLWLLPTHTAKHLCQPISPSLVLSSFHLPVWLHESSRLDFLCLPILLDSPQNCDPRGIKVWADEDSKPFQNKWLRFHQGNGIRTELIP